MTGHSGSIMEVMPEGGAIASGTFDLVTEATARARAGAAILLTVQFANIAADFYAKPGYAARFASFHVLNIALLGTLIALTWTTFFARNWRAIILIACGVLLGDGTLMSVLSHDVVPRFVSVLIFSLGCATFLPWGGFYQGILNLTCLLSFATDAFYTGGLAGQTTYLWIGLFTTLVLSQFVALYSERSRKALIVSAGELAARDAAIESARLKTLFLATMSHEIRTPLHIIMTNNYVIERHLMKIHDHSQTRAIGAVRTATKRLTQTIDHVLEISRLETNAFEVKKVALNLPGIIARLVDEFGPIAAEKGLELSSASDKSEVIIQFDEYCLVQALSNLLENAIKYTERGGVQVRLFSDSDDTMCLDVCDTGIGIDAQFMARVFEPFSQEDRRYSRRFEGAGLGLALVKRYLELNGAAIQVASKKGSGTTFQIRFPK